MAAPRATRAVVVGGGHNALTCAAYLARAGLRVTLLERRPVLGGACVTEELWPGYRISRAAYVVSLMRPVIVRELGLARYGLRLLPRVPSSFTPLPDGRALALGAGDDARAIAAFSSEDARAFPGYERQLERIARALDPLLDSSPPGRLRRERDVTPWLRAFLAAARISRDLPVALRLLGGPARAFLEERFASEPLRSTLATDAIIGAFAAPSQPGTGYVLLHHVMGEAAGRRGVWAYVAGGMGALSDSLAAAARVAGAELRTHAEVIAVRTRAGRALGVALASGEEIDADLVVSGAEPKRTFGWLDDPRALSPEHARALAALDSRSPVAKLNLALRELPRFRACEPHPPLAGTIHLGPVDLDGIERAYAEAVGGRVSDVPVVELTLPSVVDPSLAPAGRHVASIFTQYVPVLAQDDPRWPTLRVEVRERALDAVESLAPGFRASIEHCETLVAPDLERELGLTGGNIFHGAMTLDRMLGFRPVAGWPAYRTPIENLWLCGAGTHPGGGVTGACGRNAARAITTYYRG